MRTLFSVAVLSSLCLFLASGCATFRGGKGFEGKVNATEETILRIDTALKMFKIDTGRLPTDEEGLNALLIDTGIGKWYGPYIDGDNPTIDAWGTPINYTVNAGSYTLLSAGKDRQIGTRDDIKLQEAG